MYAPDCHDHGRLVLDLALGKLDETAAARAESVRTQCPVCRAWWREQLEGDAADLVDAAVAAALASVELPRQKHRLVWLAAAAALVMAIGTGGLWMAHHPGDSTPPVTADAGVIRSLSFEDPAEVAPLIHSEAPAETPAQPRVVEPAPASTEPTKIAAASNVPSDRSAPTAVEAAPTDQPLSADGFESGDLSAWDPHA